MDKVVHPMPGVVGEGIIRAVESQLASAIWLQVFTLYSSGWSWLPNHVFSQSGICRIPIPRESSMDF